MTTGPPYPRQSPVPGSNAIGSFTIGVSPIGTIAPYDPWVSIISQYANSPRLVEMILRFNAALDQTVNMENFYDFVWNVATAQGFGLDVIGRIVGVDRTIPLPASTENPFGFEEAGSWTGFGQGSFYSGGGVSDNYSLVDTDFRILILAKAASNICDGSIPAINQILLNLFPGRGVCYVADGLNMSLTYTFDFVLNPVEVAILELSGVMPNPCGVVVNISQP